MDQEKRAGTESGYTPTFDESGAHAVPERKPSTAELRAEVKKQKDVATSEGFLEAVRNGDVAAVQRRYASLVSLAMTFKDKSQGREKLEVAAEDLKNYREALRLARDCEDKLMTLLVQRTIMSICDASSYEKILKAA